MDGADPSRLRNTLFWIALIVALVVFRFFIGAPFV